MERALKIGRVRRILAASTIVGLALFASGRASAQASAIAACATESAESAGADAGVNAAGDITGDLLGALGEPVSDEGLQEQLNQVNENLATIAGFLSTTADSVCTTNNVLSSSPSLTAFSRWAQGTDPEPSVVNIPTQVGGLSGVSSSPMAREVELANGRVLTAAELPTVVDFEDNLRKKRIDGFENMEGIALTNMQTDKTMLGQETLFEGKIKSASNIVNLLAVHGAILIAIVDSLERMDEAVNQRSINEAQKGLAEADEDKVIRNDRMMTAAAL